ncbi:HAD-IB family phosphatase [Candidatus Woesearchaeota archaeon]|nr:HAD-IB family phosphatase [Candidatus Woesearchaeota archaeon]
MHKKEMLRKQMVSCIIPAYNEEVTIRKVLENVKKVSTIDEIIVVDDGSHDRTIKEASLPGITIVRHSVNRGKGAAIKTGLEYAKGDIILFLDADLYNISPHKIASIVRPIRENNADFVKASFIRARGRVTELVVKPLFKVILPFLTFHQPLSGQFAIRKQLIRNIQINDQWGVDIQILLQMVKKGVRIAEVDIGELIHKKQPIENLTIMSEQVIKTILSELGIIANKHKLIIFDFDKTLIQESSIELLAQHFQFEKQLEKLRKLRRMHRIKDFQLSLLLAQFLVGKQRKDLRVVAEQLTLAKNLRKVIQQLKRRQYNVGIVSLAFSPIVDVIAQRIGVPKQNIICPILVADPNGKYTGEVLATTKHNAMCCDKIICKAEAAKELMRRMNVQREECVAVGDGQSDECLFNACGFSIAYQPVIPIGDITIMNLAEILVNVE